MFGYDREEQTSIEIRSVQQPFDAWKLPFLPSSAGPGIVPSALPENYSGFPAVFFSHRHWPVPLDS